MKLGCCINMLGDEKDPIGRSFLPLLKDCGYDYAEIPLAQVMELADEEFAALLSELKTLGLPCLCCNNFFPAGIRLTGNSVNMQEIDGYVRAAMARASLLGAEKIVFGSSGAKNVPEGFSHEKAFLQIAEALKLVDGYAKKIGIQIVIEPLNHLESNIILNLSDGEKLMNAESYENIFLLVDYYHYRKEHDSEEVLKASLKDIRHVHFAEPEGRCFPGVIREDYRAFFDLLRNGGYDKTVSVEAYSKDPEADIKRAVFLRQLM